MSLTLADVTPIGLCVTTQALFDAKRFQTNFCDNLLLRTEDRTLRPKLVSLKKDLYAIERKFLDGHKTVIVSNIDRIIGLVLSRYLKVDLRLTESVISNGKELIVKVLACESFEDIAKLEAEFKKRITLSVYELFIGYMKKSKVSII